MRVNKIFPKTRAEGPGTRMCIYVQGCSHGCKGCFSEELWDYSGGYECSENELLSTLENVSDEIDGLTILGGEPFDKADKLSLIAKRARQLGKNVITFTGYTYEYLKEQERRDFNRLLEYTDLLIDGEFKEELLDYSRPMVGSSNQRFIYLSQRITPEDINAYTNRIEIRTDKNGKTVFNGMGNIQNIKKYIDSLSEGKND